MAIDFFISHTSADRAWAEWVAWQLEESGYTAILQSWDFRPGDNFFLSMEKALDDAERIIVIISPSYVRSAWTQSEYTAALARGRGHLLPVMIAPTEVPPILESLTKTDLVGLGEESAREALLRGVLGSGHRPRSAPLFPGRPRLEREQADFPPASSRGSSGTPEESRETSADELRALVISAEADEHFAQELCGSLQGLRAEISLSSIEIRIVGKDTARSDKEVDSRVRESNIVLLVVSRDLLATEYGSSREIRLLLRRHDDRQSIVIPIVYRTTSWDRQPFGRLVALPTGGMPVAKWTSRDEAMINIVDGVRLAADEFRQSVSPTPASLQQEILSSTAEQKIIRDLGEVFKPSGVPVLTFVEPDDFVEFRMALRQPGLGIVLEGPSGIGKTTILRHAVKQDAHRLGHFRILSARKPADIEEIKRLPGGHTGLVAVDDFHRLPNSLQDQLADYLKLLADDDSAVAKLVIVGIPGTAQGLVALGSDLATRIRVFRPGWAADNLVLQMVEKGEAALNITFDGTADIVLASVGSLLTAQMLCWHLAWMAGIEHTIETRAIVRTDIARARARVTDSLRIKYQPMIDDFIVLDDSTESLCVELLLCLAKTLDGILRLKVVQQEHPDLKSSIDRIFGHRLATGFGDAHPHIAEHLYYDARGMRLIADDPQFIFYTRQLNRDELLEAAGKRLPLPRDQVFLCYSHHDASWLDRLQVHLKPLEREGLVDLWSDRRIEIGDQWRKEIEAALARARVALLLVSGDFIASDFIQEVELSELLKAAEQGGCRIIPILVRPSLFMETPSLSRFQHVNPGDITLSEMSPEKSERILANTAKSLMTLLSWSQ